RSRVLGDQPCLCLWRGFSQITMTRPWRRITLHLSQIFLTLGLTFIFSSSLSSYPLRSSGPLLSSRRFLFVAVDDTAAGQIVGTQLNDHTVLGEDADVVLAHLARNVGEHLVAVRQLN